MTKANQDIALARTSSAIDAIDEIDGKPYDEHIEGKVVPLGYGHNEQDLLFMAQFDEQKKKKMYRKVDYRLIPMLALLYLVAYIDRANIGNAKIEGITTDLKIVGTEWNVVVSVFFVSYVLCEVPSNAILQKYFRERPSIYMSILIIGWGIVTTCIAATQNYVGLAMTRFALGICEAGFFPGAILLCSYWYPRYMLQTRIALFYTSSATAGAFSGLLAFAIAKMNGLGGIAGWRYIFLLEGLATIVIGISVPWLLIDTPGKSKWLDEDEKRYITLAVQTQDGGSAAQHRAGGVDFKALLKVLSDWHIYFFSLMYWAASVPHSAFVFTLPTIIRGMGYTSAQAQLLTIPCYFVGAVSAYLGGRFADKYKRRYPFIVGPLCIVIIAMAIVFPLAPNITQYIAPGYFAICLAHLGMYPLGPCINTWTTNSLAGPAKRAMGISFMLAMGNSGSIIGSYIFLDREAPRYPTGYGTALAISFVGGISATIIMLTFRFNNKEREKMSEEYIRANYTDKELAELGDRSPLYRYTL